MNPDFVFSIVSTEVTRQNSRASILCTYFPHFVAPVQVHFRRRHRKSKYVALVGSDSFSLFPRYAFTRAGPVKTAKSARAN